MNGLMVVTSAVSCFSWWLAFAVTQHISVAKSIGHNEKAMNIDVQLSTVLLIHA